MTIETCPDCGWQSKPSTPARAAYALRKHSCDRHRARLAAAERGRAREAAVDRTPKPCQHKHANHSHGTYAAYVLDKCRCLPCAKASADYEANRVRTQAYGRWTHWADAGPVRNHLEALRAAGIGYKRVADLAGVHNSAVVGVIYGKPGRAPVSRIKASTAEALLAVTPDADSIAGGTRIDATGTRRRLRALVAIGWSLQRLTDEAGVDRQRFDATVRAARTHVNADTARVVAAVYDRLWDSPPTATDRFEKAAITRSINHAKRHGWAPPLAWDDDTIDDPDAAPDELDQSDPRRKVHVEDVEWLMSQDRFTAQALADRFGVGRSAIQAALARAGRQDLLDELVRNLDAVSPDGRFEARAA